MFYSMPKPAWSALIMFYSVPRKQRTKIELPHKICVNHFLSAGITREKERKKRHDNVKNTYLY